MTCSPTAPEPRFQSGTWNERHVGASHPGTVVCGAYTWLRV